MRVAVIGGVRTPFVKAASALIKSNAMDLSVHVLNNIVRRLKLDPEKIDELLFGAVLQDPRIPQMAREMVLRTGLPKSIVAHTVTNNCISGLVAAAIARDGIMTGRLRAALAGGVESMSNPTLTYPTKGEKFFLSLSRARTTGQKVSLLAKFRPSMLFPKAPSPKEPSTGLTMGEHCEITAKEFGTSRESQDKLALASHKNAAEAKEKGLLAEFIEPVGKVDSDNLIRGDTSLEQLAKLKPVFDRSAEGTITAGNASSLTDGASIVCLMSEEEAKAQGKTPIGFIEAVEFAAIPPGDGLLMAPVLAVSNMLKKANLGFKDIDLFEVHEAFAAQVLATRDAWAKGWKRYPDMKPLGEIPDDKLNVNGGSLAMGHPFAATGGRLILAACQGLRERKAKRALISVCAAGAAGGAMLITRD